MVIIRNNKENKHAAKPNSKVKAKSKLKLKPYDTKSQEISKVSDIDFSGTYSYAAYLKWKFEERVELIRGKIFEMSAPQTLHQRVLMEISVPLYLYLKEKPCEAFVAPFDVRLPGKSKKNEDIFTVVQPDICVVCDQNKIDRKGCIGAPDIVIEILSPGNSKKELKLKYDLYEEFGVREYWIVDPAETTFLKYVLSEEHIFIAGQPYTGDSEFISDVLPGFRLNINEVFGIN